MKKTLTIAIVATAIALGGVGIALAATSSPTAAPVVHPSHVAKGTTPVKAKTAPKPTAKSAPGAKTAPGAVAKTGTGGSVGPTARTGGSASAPPPTSSISAPGAPVTAPPPAPVYTAAVDPSFTQDPSNPLAVTYTYTASSNESPLPAGILNLNTPGGTQPNTCSINVGPSMSGSTCLVNYPATGVYQVTTQYIPNGVTAVTQTDTETISPYATSTTVSLSGSFTATAAVHGPSGNLADFISISFTDTTTGKVIWSAPTGPNFGLAFSFYFANGELRDAYSALAFANAADSFSVSMSFMGTNGYLPSSSGAVAIP